jgi:membrane-associated protease RseP (regulator of RpoE activity)
MDARAACFTFRYPAVPKLRKVLLWPLPVLLVATLLAIPTDVRAEDKPTVLTHDKIKELEEYKKQLAELQKKIAEMEKKTSPTTPEIAKPSEPEGALPQAVSSQFKWRNIGPANMGGRVVAMAVNEQDPMNYWIGLGGGGLAMTKNNGTTFEMQFDKEKTCSIGDVAVSASDPKILYVGTGENNPRNSVSYGDGVYKSVDSGKTWKNVGLEKTFQIGKIIIHPKNPDIVYVGAKGRLYGANPDRGVFKTEDGGKTWKKIHFIDDKTGVIDMRLDPTDNETLLVAYWEHKRDEFDGFFGNAPVPDSYGPIVTHGANSGLWKTTDGGKTFKKLSAGLPTVKIGRIGLDYSRKTKGLVYAIVDTEKVGTGNTTGAYFGAVIDDAKEKGGALLSTVTADAPAAKAGLKDGDIVIKSGDKKITTADEFLGTYSGSKAGDKLALVVLRAGKEEKIEVTLGTRPDPNAPPPATPSAGFTAGRAEGGVAIATVTENGPVAKAGIKDGDVITAVDGKVVANLVEYRAQITGKKEGDKVKLTVKRGTETKEYEVVLGPPVAGAGNNVTRGQTSSKPYGLGLGGQQPNIQSRQGKDAFETGGVFVSKDNGEKWERVNSLNPRPMYFSQIRVDPTDDNTVYVLCDTPAPMYRSTDGGKKFDVVQSAGGVHADAHTLWINPKESRHLIIGCDGGFYVSYDKGAKWDHLNTLALGQFYHVAVDNRKPYRVYGGLQDNGSWGGPSDTLKRTGMVNEDWVFVSGGDGFVCRVDQNDPDLVYSESQGGAISRRNYRTGESAGIRVPRADNDTPLRFNWNTPFILSSHNSNIFYCGAQYVFRSVKKGDDLKVISPDLTRTKAGSLVAVAESPKNADFLWAGSDDGFVWLSKDGGIKWDNVTENIKKAGLPDFRTVATIEPSRDKAGRVYVAFDGHRFNDDKPYLFMTEDNGTTWKNISSNLPAFGSTRCLREDYVVPTILYCGTEFGAFVSLNKGESWAKLGDDLPTVACHEFAQPTTANELVLGTHGRSVWILDINAIRQMKPDTFKSTVTLYTPAPATRWRLNANGASPYSETDRKFVGENPTRGAVIDFHLKEKAKKVTLKVQDVTGTTVWEYSAGGQGAGRPGGPGGQGGPGATGAPRTPTVALSDAGHHRIVWGLSSNGGGTRAGGAAGNVKPGQYRVLLNVDDKDYSAAVQVEIDPSLPKDAVQEEYDESEIDAYRKSRKKEGRLDD